MRISVICAADIISSQDAIKNTFCTLPFSSLPPPPPPVALRHFHAICMCVYTVNIMPDLWETQHDVSCYIASIFSEAILLLYKKILFISNSGSIVFQFSREINIFCEMLFCKHFRQTFFES